MPVSNETIINKMIAELETAKRDSDNHEQVKIRIEKVRTLIELFEESFVPDSIEKTPATLTSPIVTAEESEMDFTDAELKAMLGDSTKSKKVQSKNADDTDANGDSLFDF